MLILLSKPLKPFRHPPAPPFPAAAASLGMKFATLHLNTTKQKHYTYEMDTLHPSS